MTMDDQEIESALAYINSDDRELWVTMAMAVKSELGEAGFSAWSKWSRGSRKYNARQALIVWRSVGSSGRVGIGSLFHAAKLGGWQGKRSKHGVSAQRPTAPPPPAETRPTPEAVEEIRATMARAEAANHPYLERKGFPFLRLLCDGSKLVVPMFWQKQTVCLQTITPDGAKKFTAGGRASGASFRMGTTLGRYALLPWWVEGLATGLSIRAALAYLSRQQRVIICFSAHNLQQLALQNRRGIVIADNDKNGVGEKAARATRLPYWIPPELGDANDFHLRYGLKALAEQLRGFDKRRFG